MRNYRINSFMAGLLYLLGTIFGVFSAVFGGKLISSTVQTKPLSGVVILDLVVADSSQIILGSILILMMGILLVLMTVFLYPLFKKDSEELAMGMLLFRGAMEGSWYFITTVSILAFVSLGEGYASTGANAETFEAMGEVLYKFQDILGPIGTIFFVIGATCIYISFYRTGLIPKWISLWGLISLIPYLTYAMLHLYRVDSGFGFYLQMPLAIQEMVMAFWLIFKGFNQLNLRKLLSNENSRVNG